LSSSDDLIRSHSHRNPESHRLLEGPGRLEFERTKALIARQAVLQQCFQALRPDGVLPCACISRFASLLDGYRGGSIRDPVFERLVNEDLARGAHSPARAGGVET
jgi:hypothetical protein